MRLPESSDPSTYHITVSHIPLSGGYLIRFNILFKPVGQIATIIVQTELTGLKVFSVQKPEQTENY